MNKWLTIASAVCYSIAATSAFAPANAKTSDDFLSRKIIGSWVDTKVVTFRPNGHWELRKYQSAAPTPGHFTWTIRDGKLIEERDGETFVLIIKSLTDQKLVLEAPDPSGKFKKEGVNTVVVYTRTQLQ